MRIAIKKSKNFENIYIARDVYIDRTHRKTVTHKKLGRIDLLMEQMNMTRDEVIVWAKQQADIETDEFNKQKDKVTVDFFPEKIIDLGVQRSFNVGYLFLQSICSDLRIDNICRNIKNRHSFKYNLEDILNDLIYTRILYPSSKLSSFEDAHQFLEQPKYSLHDVYRALSVLSKENDYIQAEIYKNSNLVVNRNHSVLYYDCTNYFFECEQEDDFRKYGKSKEHRPAPIVQMGLFMDTDGIPLAFSVFPGNQSEQKSATPLEQQILSEYGFDKFIYCADAGLGSSDIRKFNNVGEKAFIVTQSVKKLKDLEKEAALDHKYWKVVGGGNAFVDLDTIDLEKCKDYLFYKDEPVKISGLEQRLIITFSPKYALYQKKIREAQVERAKKLIQNGTAKRNRKNPTDPARFTRTISMTEDGEVAQHTMLELDQTKIDEEAMYDGIYAIATNLEDEDVSGILHVSEQRWQIEECFRIMKTDFEARPVYVSREDHIRGHFMTCYLALLVYRILEKKLDSEYTVENIIETLRSMNVTRIEGTGYIPSYTRTDLTDALHKSFDFRTDNEIITNKKMRNIIKTSKER